MIEYIVLTITLLSFSLASYEDIKKREVYDYLNFLFAISILSIAIFDSILTNSFDPIKYSGFGMLLSFLIGAILYLIGMWGGGDAKFLIGFGAAIPYLKQFAADSVPNFLYSYLISKSSSLMLYITEITQIYILGLNLVVILFIFYFITRKREKFILYNAIIILVVLIFLSLGLFLEVDPFILFLWGLIAFSITFFSDDYLLNSLYFVLKKKTNFLKESDIIDSDVKIKNKLISQEELREGIPRNLFEDIKQNYSYKTINVRKILPIGYILLLNFILFGIKILSIDKFNLEILAYLLKFLLVSFFFGGIIAIFMMFFFSLRNMNKLKKVFSKLELYLLLILLILIPILYLINIVLISIPLIGFIYYFIKISKNLESQMFIQDKLVKDLVPGDWIVEDLIIGDKTYFKQEDFKLGVDEIQLEKIKGLSLKHKEFKSILFKDGLAFLPPLFIGFLILLII